MVASLIGLILFSADDEAGLADKDPKIYYLFCMSCMVSLSFLA
jgi:hypothetical protein